MNIIKEIRHAYRLWELERFYYEQEAPLLALALGDYSVDECVFAVFKNPTIPWERKGIVAQLLVCRTGRGRLTPEESLSYYGVKPK